MIVSDFIIEAENLKEANKIAQSHKRLERKGRTRVKRIKVGSINSIFYFLHKTAEPFNCLEQDNLA